jgi:hypothetical protein
MNYNLIGIDPSLISTALCVNGKLFNYCRESDIHNKSSMKRWFREGEPFITYRNIVHRKFTEYSEGELIKLNDYDKISDDIITDIKNNINTDLETYIAIEGYSYSSLPTSIIDLVTFSTILRKKLLEITKNITILSPSTLKKEACMISYKPVDIGKKKEKLEWRNNQGILGGSFKKPQMFLAFVENTNIITEFHKHCNSIKDEILSNTDVPKPYNDIIDSVMLYYYLVGKVK